MRRKLCPGGIIPFGIVFCWFFAASVPEISGKAGRFNLKLFM